jgi:hypothetical protein
MTVLKRSRKAQSHTATGKTLAMFDAAKTVYPAWPKDLVDLPTKRKLRTRALGWFDHFIRHREPAAWQPADPARIAELARAHAAWEHETYLLQERDGGDTKRAEIWRAAIAQWSRQLGLSVAIRDPRLLANDAMVRAENDQAELGFKDDDLLARPGRLN